MATSTALQSLKNKIIIKWELLDAKNTPRFNNCLRAHLIQKKTVFTRRIHLRLSLLWLLTRRTNLCCWEMENSFEVGEHLLWRHPTLWEFKQTLSIRACWAIFPAPKILKARLMNWTSVKIDRCYKLCYTIWKICDPVSNCIRCYDLQELF
jgi:hypothetical protein